MEENKTPSPHKFQLDNRRKGMLTGVRDVSAFDEKEILLETGAGAMTIRGENLSITRLDLERGQVDLKGRVDSVTYTKDGTSQAQKGKNFVARLFK